MNAKKLSLFDKNKAAHAAAFLLSVAGEPLSTRKLHDLLYLAERLCLQRYGEFIMGDQPVARTDGVELPALYTLMRKHQENNVWNTLIERVSASVLRLKATNDTKLFLGYLSDIDVEVLQETWDTYGELHEWQLKETKFIKEHFPEWEDPKLAAGKPIPYSRLLETLGFDEQQVSGLLERYEEHAYIQAQFASTPTSEQHALF
jgi:uncharacterized phage-associated protein